MRDQTAQSAHFAQSDLDLIYQQRHIGLRKNRKSAKVQANVRSNNRWNDDKNCDLAIKIIHICIPLFFTLIYCEKKKRNMLEYT